MNNEINFKKTRDIGEIIKDSFRFVRHELKPLFTSVLLYAGPMILIYAISAAYYQGETQKLAINNSGSTDIFSMYPIKALLYMMAALSASSILVLSITNSYINLYITKGRGTFNTSDVWEQAKQYLLKYLIYTVSISALVALLAITIVGPIWIYTALSLVFYVNMTENQGVKETFLRSQKLIEGHWWFTFGLYLLTNIIVSVFSSIFSIGLIAIQVIQTVSGFDEDLHTAFLILAALIAFISYFLYVILFVTQAMQYHNLVERKESPSLKDRINKINR